jgi:hypothetical protein
MDTREQLLHVLAEAAELEHNILCSYLYAAFSLKQQESEDLTPAELAKVAAWRRELMSICIEEMIHLAQVANLTVAIGARPHFNRPNFPVAKGYHPAAIELALTPFDLDTLEHFIFLERPEDAPDQDAPPLAAAGGPPRQQASSRELMPSAPEYATIGEFYALLQQGFASVSEAIGERRLFCGSASHQLRGQELNTPDLLVVTDLASATAALETIVVQGEGSRGHREESHYRRLAEIKAEYQAMQRARPTFCPHRPVARNPVMRPPQEGVRIHVVAPQARRHLDAANGVYNLMLAALTAAFDTGEGGAERAALVGVALALMRALAALSDRLTQLPAAEEPGSPNGGVTFTILRSTEGISPGADAAALVAERVDVVVDHLASLAGKSPQLETAVRGLREARAGLG